MVAGGLLPMRMPPPPPPGGAPLVTFLVRRELGVPSTAHLLRARSGRVIVLTSTPQVHALLQLVPGPMNSMTIRDHVLLWDNSVVHTLPGQDRFQ